MSVRKVLKEHIEYYSRFSDKFAHAPTHLMEEMLKRDKKKFDQAIAELKKGEV